MTSSRLNGGHIVIGADGQAVDALIHAVLGGQVKNRAVEAFLAQLA